jgi:hypothetical protein
VDHQCRRLDRDSDRIPATSEPLIKGMIGVMTRRLAPAGNPGLSREAFSAAYSERSAASGRPTIERTSEAAVSNQRRALTELADTLDLPELAALP